MEKIDLKMVPAPVRSTPNLLVHNALPY